MFSIRAVLAAGCVAALCALPQAGAAADVPAAALSPSPRRSPTAHREAETAKAHRG